MLQMTYYNNLRLQLRPENHQMCNLKHFEATKILQTMFY